MRSIALGILVVLTVWGRAAAGEPATALVEEGKLPVGFCVVPEMDYIPEVDDWERCEPEAFPDEVARAVADWQKKRPWVEKRLTPELVRALSGWAKTQMEQYDAVPPLAKVALKPVCHHERSRKLVLEGTVDTLPTHAAVVTRWLRIYVLCEKHSGTVVRATITIRGQLEE